MAKLNRAGGLILLLFFVWFMTVMVRKAMKHPEQAEEDFKPMKIWLTHYDSGRTGRSDREGAQLIVPAATRIAESWGVSQSVIGLTIIALGTSLPELATSAVAAFRKTLTLLWEMW